MVKKQNWKKFLRHILLVTNFLIVSCMIEDFFEEIPFFVYKNQSSVVLDIETYGQEGLLDTLSIKPLATFMSTANNPIFTMNQSNNYAKIIYDQKKYTIFYSRSFMIDSINSDYDCDIGIRNPYCLKSYTIESERINKAVGHIFLTYTFTEEDYRNATPLVFGEGFVGSVWRCTVGAGLQEGLLYNELRFVSESEVEGWVQLEGESEAEMYFTATYSITDETITISDDGDSFTAVLNEDYSGLVTNIDGEGECVFVKQ